MNGNELGLRSGYLDEAAISGVMRLVQIVWWCRMCAGNQELSLDDIKEVPGDEVSQ